MVIYKIYIDDRPFKEVVVNERSDNIFKDIVKKNWKDLEDYNYEITVTEKDITEERYEKLAKQIEEYNKKKEGK